MFLILDLPITRYAAAESSSGSGARWSAAYSAASCYWLTSCFIVASRTLADREVRDKESRRP